MEAEVTSLDDFQEGILINVLANGGSVIGITEESYNTKKLEVNQLLSKDIFLECGVSPELEGVLWG